MKGAVFFRGDTVLLFKCPIETGIVSESIGLANVRNGHTGAKRLFAQTEAFFCNILMNRKPQIFLKYMGNVVFADIKLFCKPF